MRRVMKLKVRQSLEEKKGKQKTSADKKLIDTTKEAELKTWLR